MSNCEQARPAPLQCRSPHEVLEQVLQLLPRGRAWQSNEGGPLLGLVRAFDAGVFDEPPFQTKSRVPSKLLGFWRSIDGTWSLSPEHHLLTSGLEPAYGARK